MSWEERTRSGKEEAAVPARGCGQRMPSSAQLAGLEECSSVGRLPDATHHKLRTLLSGLVTPLGTDALL
eukprot:1072912-Alexandrium_andersonii.AAC.1